MSVSRLERAQTSGGLDTEAVQDVVAAMFTDTPTVDFTYDDSAGTITATAAAGYTNEEAQDAVGTILVDSSTFDFTYTDATPSISGAVLDSPLLQGQNGAHYLARANHTGTQIATTISDFTEASQDVIGALLVDSSTLDFTYNDAGNAETVAVIPSGIDHGALADLTLSDDHTQYALLAGRAGGQIFNGGTAASDHLDLRANDEAYAATNTGRLRIYEQTQLFPDSITVGNRALKLFECGTTFTMDNAGSNVQAIQFGPAMTYTTSPAYGIPPFLFAVQPAVNISGSLNMSAFCTLYNGPTYTVANGFTFTLQDSLAGFMDTPIFNRAGTGQYDAAAIYSGFKSAAFIGPGASINTLRAFVVNDASGAGTLGTRVGLDVNSLTKATLNIGIRNASTTVNTPSATQTLAAGTAIVANASVVQIQSTGAVVSTAAPLIADGQSGQVLRIINVDSADNFTVTDEATLAGSNVRLNAVATTYVMGPRDTLDLIYNATIGAWIETGRSNNT